MPWLLILALGALLSSSVTGRGHAATRKSRVAVAPVAGRTTLDLRYGEHARGVVAVVARVRRDRVLAVFTVKRLTLPGLGTGRRGALLFSASTLCGGRFGVVRTTRSVSFAAPARGLRLPAETLSVRLGA